MSQTEHATSQSLASVWVARPTAVEGREGLDSVRERIAAGQAVLRVVEYPWGVEFDLFELGGQP
jgi:hypothetical protein